MQTPGFLHIDAGNIITWGVVAVAWLVNRSMDWRGLADRMRWMEKWQEGHETEANKRDDLLQKMEVAVERLTTLSEVAQSRIDRMEQK